MNPLARIVAELERRVTMLPDDVDALAGAADANDQGAGLPAGRFDARKRPTSRASSRSARPS